MNRSRTMQMELQGETRQVPSYSQMLASMLVPTLTVMHHPRLKRIGERALLPALLHGEAIVEVSRLTPEFAPPDAKSGFPLATHFISRKALVLRPLKSKTGSAGAGAQAAGMPGASAGIVVDATALGDGQVRLDGQAVSGAVEVSQARLTEGVVLELGSQIVLLVHLSQMQDEPTTAPRLGLVGDSDAMRDVREAIVRAARQPGPVMVRGETGSGKELVASAVHQASPRKDAPYLAVNMAAVPPTLAASELFGHAKGAFSGAHQASAGMFGRAHGGTLFMDEIGDTPMDVQAALLRVLETGEVQQVGADRVKQVDVRVIAATDADLDQLIASGRFRAPLRYRLANLEIRVPPLRERRDDVGRLLLHFLQLELAGAGRSEEIDTLTPEGTSWIPAALTARLARYLWPGNVRQLRNVARWLAAVDTKTRPLDAADPALTTLLVGELPGGIAERTTVDAGEVHPNAAITAPGPRVSGVVPAVGSLPTAGLRPPVASATGTTTESKPPEKKKTSLSNIGPDELERLMVEHDYKLGAVADVLGVSRPALNDLVDAHPRLRRAQNLSLEELVAARAHCGDIDSMWRYLRVSEKSLKLRMSALGLLS